jgi:hypothetical protein
MTRALVHAAQTYRDMDTTPKPRHGLILANPHVCPVPSRWFGFRWFKDGSVFRCKCGGVWGYDSTYHWLRVPLSHWVQAGGAE